MAERNPADETGDARFRMIADAGEELRGMDLVGYALDHAVTVAGGLGGMVHLRGPGGRGLLLMAVNGLARTALRDWEEIEESGPTAPARAVDGGVRIWVSGEDAAPQARVRALQCGYGLLAVPLLTPGGVAGALSVLTVAGEEPSRRQVAAVEALAAWVAVRLRAQSATLGQVESGGLWERPPATPLRQAMEAVRVGSWEWDLATGEQVWDERTGAILGMDPAPRKPRFETWTSLVHRDDLPWVLVEVEQAIRNRRVLSLEYRVCRPDGTVVWISARARVMPGKDGEPERMVGTVWDITESRITRDWVGRALRHMSDAFFAVDSEWHITFVNVEAERLFGTSNAVLGRTLWEALTGIGVDAAALGLEARYRHAAERGTPVEFDVQWPANQRLYHMRLVPVPDGLTVYATDVTEKRAREADRAAAEHAAAERSVRITELTSALAEALTVRDVVNAAAERILPPFNATGLVVQFIEAETIRVAGAVGYPQAFLKRLDGTPVEDISPVDEVFHSRTPVVIDSVEEYIARYPKMAALPGAGDKRAWAFLPLIVSGRAIGCCVISFAESRHLLGEELALLTALSGLIAQSIERARLYDTEHTQAQELQRGLLPHALPSTRAVSAVARYLPAAEGTNVGGDWYDVIPLSGTRVALVIGDVMGHGLPEAATMGQLRTAVRTLADLEYPPAELLTRLNDLVSGMGDDFYATCLYAVYDPVLSICTIACAGHPPPALVHPGGTARFIDLVPGPPLGSARLPFEAIDVPVPEGSLLVLYTDGLVESAAQDLDRGMAHLASALRTAASNPGRGHGATARRGAAEGESASLERVCDDVLASLLAKEPLTDDAALLIARTRAAAPGDVVAWSLPDGPIAAGEARDHVQKQLLLWGLSPLATTTELLVSELVGNAVRHGKTPIGLRLLRSEVLICEVSDASATTPRIRHASDTDEGGRGLQLVAAFSQRWGSRYTTTGKCIWTEQPLP
ncbi:SpoIIE family protein phosphatase [Streptomyces sp. NPDC087525]|uniref:SpoIIE family protein phosphatase n=1 Tax=Streptomyces sp. NPDC087525 TaxID=3365793 RepID=UPI0037F6F50B